jgi:hypothetical protein
MLADAAAVAPGWSTETKPGRLTFSHGGALPNSPARAVAAGKMSTPITTPIINADMHTRRASVE